MAYIRQLYARQARRALDLMQLDARRTRNERRSRHIRGRCAPVYCLMRTVLRRVQWRRASPSHPSHYRRRAMRATCERATRDAGDARAREPPVRARVRRATTSARATEPSTRATCNTRGRASRRTARPPALGSNPGGSTTRVAARRSRRLTAAAAVGGASRAIACASAPTSARTPRTSCAASARAHAAASLPGSPPSSPPSDAARAATRPMKKSAYLPIGGIHSIHPRMSIWGARDGRGERARARAQ